MLDVIQKLSNAKLLDEIKEDAMSNIELVYSHSFIDCIVDFALQANTEGIEGLLAKIERYPKDIPLFADTIQYLKYVLDGMVGEELLTKMSEDYWRLRKREKKFDEEAAFVRYFTMISILCMVEHSKVDELYLFMIEELHEWCLGRTGD